MVATAPAPAPRRRYTLPEFLTLADELELAGGQEWYEVIGGELVAHASPNNAHMRPAVALLLFLGDAQRAGYGSVGVDRTVALDYTGPNQPIAHAYKPDAFFVTPEREGILDRPDTPSVAGAPDIVVEVLSHSTSRFDRPPRGKRFLADQQYGVRFYWLVNTLQRTITTYERREGRLVEAAVLRRGDTLRCPLFPELGLPLEQVFR